MSWSPYTEADPRMICNTYLGLNVWLGWEYGYATTYLVEHQMSCRGGAHVAHLQSDLPCGNSVILYSFVINLTISAYSCASWSNPWMWQRSSKAVLRKKKTCCRQHPAHFIRPIKPLAVFVFALINHVLYWQQNWVQYSSYCLWVLPSVHFLQTFGEL